VLEVRDKQVLLVNDDGNGIQTLPLAAERNIFASFVDEVVGTDDCIVTSEEAFTATRASLVAREAADTGHTLAV
jgi:hypothetical protein